MSEKMIFCIGESGNSSKGDGFQKTLQIFNKSVSEELYSKTLRELNIKNFQIPIATWIDVKDIYKPSTTQKQLGGYLKVLSYKEAWSEMWSKLSNENKKFLLSLPNFDPKIFEEITGVKPDVLTLSGKEVSVTLDGVTYTAIIK